jgi:MFS family permease
MFSSLITNSSFMRLCLAQFIALTAGYATHFKSAVFIEDLTHASGPMGGLVISTVMPGLLAGLWSGGLVDRYNRAYLLAASFGLRILASMLFLLPIPTGDWLPVVYLVNFLLAVLVQFELTTEAALLPDLVDKTQLLAANGIFGLNALAAQGIGFLVVVLMLRQTGGLAVTGSVAGLSFLAALILVVTFLRQPKTSVCHWIDRSEPSRTVEYSTSPLLAVNESLVSPRAGWNFVSTDHPTRKAVIHLAAIYTLLMVLVTLLPGFLARVVGQSTVEFIILAIPAGLGFGLGTVIVSRYGHRFDAGLWGSGGLILNGLALIIMAVWQSGSAIAGLTLAVVFLGSGLALVIIPARAVLQSRPPAALRGRVWATQVVLSNAAALLPIILMGSLADRIGIQRVLFLISLIALVVGLVDIPTRLKDDFLKGVRW